MNREELVRILSSMTNAEFSELAAEARGVDDSDIRNVIVRELQHPIALASDEIKHRAID